MTSNYPSLIGRYYGDIQRASQALDMNPIRNQPTSPLPIPARSLRINHQLNNHSQTISTGERELQMMDVYSNLCQVISASNNLQHIFQNINQIRGNSETRIDRNQRQPSLLRRSLDRMPSEPQSSDEISIESHLNYQIKCPICRCVNKINLNQQTIYGIEMKCIICKETNIQVYLPSCGHSVVCWSCVQKLNDTNLNDDQNELILPNNVPASVYFEAMDRFSIQLGSVYILLIGPMNRIWCARREGIGESMEFMELLDRDISQLLDFTDGYSRIS